jgi:hypothetical protein
VCRILIDEHDFFVGPSAQSPSKPDSQLTTTGTAANNYQSSPHLASHPGSADFTLLMTLLNCH